MIPNFNVPKSIICRITVFLKCNILSILAQKKKKKLISTKCYKLCDVVIFFSILRTTNYTKNIH